MHFVILFFFFVLVLVLGEELLRFFFSGIVWLGAHVIGFMLVLVIAILCLIALGGAAQEIARILGSTVTDYVLKPAVEILIIFGPIGLWIDSVENWYVSKRIFRFIGAKMARALN